MPLPTWLAVVIAVPLVLFLLAICVGSARQMSFSDVKSQHSMSLGAIVVLMLITVVDRFIYLLGIPFIGFGIALVILWVVWHLVYSLIVGMVLLFRQRHRSLGIQMLIVSVLALWWWSLARVGDPRWAELPLSAGP